MRLFEFNQEPPVKAVLRDYIRKGYTRIGEPSASAAVFASPDHKEVIKVGKTSDCWLNFAEKIKGSSNPHVPKIKSLNIYGSHYLAVIEFLKEVPETYFRSPMYRKMASWMYYKGKWRNARDVYLHSFTPGQIKKMALDLEENEPHLVAALQMVIDTKGSCNYDCHPTNLMRRGSSTIVVSDPLTHQG